jgi:hypothetical protein
MGLLRGLLRLFDEFALSGVDAVVERDPLLVDEEDRPAHRDDHGEQDRVGCGEPGHLLA